MDRQIGLSTQTSHGFITDKACSSHKDFCVKYFERKSPHNLWITWKATFIFGNNQCNCQKKSTNHNLSVMNKPFSVNDYIFWSFLRCNTLEVLIFWRIQNLHKKTKKYACNTFYLADNFTLSQWLQLKKWIDGSYSIENVDCLSAR